MNSFIQLIHWIKAIKAEETQEVRKYALKIVHIKS